MWAKHVNLNFVEQMNPESNADIIIEFGSREHGDSIPFDGPSKLLALIEELYLLLYRLCTCSRFLSDWIKQSRI